MTEREFFDIFIVCWIALALVTFVSLFWITAPYGKFTRSGWGPRIDRRIGWIVMETPAVLLILVFFLLGDRQSSKVALFFLAMWQIHYIYRAFVFPWRMRGEKKQMTLITMLLAIVFNSGNGYLNGRYLFSLGEPRPVEWLGDPRFIIGALLFFSGLAINIHSDGVLRSLRRPGEAAYQIPRRGLFRRVSAANYLGELIEWSGWAIATWSPAGLVFLIWTAANLVPRARAQHRWYRANFPDYPQSRKALIPFIY
jgi:protein-S-isoprenylcysteine O-methyltransferase Ste14